MVRAIIEYEGKTHEIELDVTESIEFLRYQLYSACELSPELQSIHIDGVDILNGNNVEKKLNTFNIQFKDDIKIILKNKNKPNNSNNNNNVLESKTSTVTPPIQSNSIPSANTNPLSAEMLANALRNLPIFQQLTQAAANQQQQQFQQPLQIDLQSTCSRSFFGYEAISQPSVLFNGKAICMSCAQTCHLPNECRPPNSVDPFICECANIQGSECIFAARSLIAADQLFGPIKTQAKLKLSQVANQQFNAANAQAIQQFMARLQSYARAVLEYENESLQSQARSIIPIQTLTERANKVISEYKAEDVKLSFKDQLVKQLLAWFKYEFFKWTNQPECEHCKQSNVEGIGGTHPNAEESMYKAGIVELYKCKSCNKITRFPRYNHSGKLLETRRGRCGEFANCFTLCARSLGYEVRTANDFTDHIWTEIYSESQQRWIHCDSCENSWDSPLMYEGGWGKKLNYIIAFSKDEAIDVTKRYTKNYKEVLTRRNMVPESWLTNAIQTMNNEKFNKLPKERQNILLARRPVEIAEFERNQAPTQAAVQLKPEEQAGRITGSDEWKSARGELGDKDKTKQVEQKHLIEQIKVIQATNNNDSNNKPNNDDNKCKPDSTTCTVPINNNATTNTNANNNTSIDKAKERVKLIFQAYQKQLTTGCNSTTCTNEYCKKNATFQSPDASKLAALCLKLTKDFKETKLCNPI